MSLLSFPMPHRLSPANPVGFPEVEEFGGWEAEELNLGRWSRETNFSDTTPSPKTHNPNRQGAIAAKTSPGSPNIDSPQISTASPGTVCVFLYLLLGTLRTRVRANARRAAQGPYYWPLMSGPVASALSAFYLSLQHITWVCPGTAACQFSNHTPRSHHVSVAACISTKANAQVDVGAYQSRLPFHYPRSEARDYLYPTAPTSERCTRDMQGTSSPT